MAPRTKKNCSRLRLPSHPLTFYDELNQPMVAEVNAITKKRQYEAAAVAISQRLQEPLTFKDRMTLVADVLYETLAHCFWAGFYIPRRDVLLLGPGAGPPACAEIDDDGVCGTAARKLETLLVPDVHKFPGHIICDPRAKSEIVVPVIDSAGTLIAVLDLDSSTLAAFDEIDKEALEELVRYVFAADSNLSSS